MSLSAQLRKDWPPLPYDDWADTAATLHLWTQVVGKVRMALTPPLNHWWHVPLYVSARGLTTSAIPDRGRSFEIEFNFLDHRLDITCSDGARETVDLRPMTVADFHAAVMAALARLGVRVRIWTTPCELPEPIPFDQDRVHGAYDAPAVERFWRVLVQADRVMKVFRARFIGKSSPAHFFWGSFDLAATRFSGRRAPPHPGSAILPASVSLEAYSHEVSSCGFWPGGPGQEPVFYAYAYPEPRGFRDVHVTRLAEYDEALGEFVLPYEAARLSHAPDFAILNFFQRAYEAAADLGGWPRAELDRRSP